MNLPRLSLNLLRRDWRAGEWRVLLLALVLAVGSLATVGLFADRVRQAIAQLSYSARMSRCQNRLMFLKNGWCANAPHGC